MTSKETTQTNGIELLPLQIHMAASNRPFAMNARRDDPVEAPDRSLSAVPELLDLPQLDIYKEPDDHQNDTFKRKKVPSWLLLRREPSQDLPEVMLHHVEPEKDQATSPIAVPTVVNTTILDKVDKVEVANPQEPRPLREPPPSVLSLPDIVVASPPRLYTKSINAPSEYIGDLYHWKALQWMGSKLKAVTIQGDLVCVEFFPATDEVTRLIEDTISRMQHVPFIGSFLGYDILHAGVVDRSVSILSDRRELPPSEYLCCVYTTFLAGSILVLDSLVTDSMRELVLIKVIRQVLQSLSILHSRGIRHGRVLSRHMHVIENHIIMREPALIHGHVDPVYSPPEGTLSIPGDVWCVGLLCMELQSGKPPEWRSAENDYLKLRFEISVSPALPKMPWFTASGSQFVRMCLTKKVERRPSVATLLQHPWLS